jgi:hypothetical protein
MNSQLLKNNSTNSLNALGKEIPLIEIYCLILSSGSSFFPRVQWIQLLNNILPDKNCLIFCYENPIAFIAALSVYVSK